MKWVWNNGPWGLCYFRFASRLGGIINGHPQHFHFNITNNHFPRIVIFYQYFGLVFPNYSTIVCMPIPIIFLIIFQHTNSFHLSLVHNKRIPSGIMLFVLSHLHDFHLDATTHFTCDFISLDDGMYIVGPIHIYDTHICGTYLFTLPSLVCNIRISIQPTKCVI
jgi:hypothetical protein